MGICTCVQGQGFSATDSEDNRKDVEDIKPIYVEGLSFHYVKNIDDVISYIFKD